MKVSIRSRAGKILYFHDRDNKDIQDALRYVASRKKPIRGAHILNEQLMDINLEGLNAPGIIFENCTLKYVSLRYSNLEGATFINCILDRVDLFEANLKDITTSACLTNLVVPQLIAA
jgi:uncharacterized protein YjbI with pentapeptide repeats